MIPAICHKNSNQASKTLHDNSANMNNHSSSEETGPPSFFTSQTELCHVHLRGIDPQHLIQSEKRSFIFSEAAPSKKSQGQSTPICEHYNARILIYLPSLALYLCSLFLSLRWSLLYVSSSNFATNNSQCRFIYPDCSCVYLNMFFCFLCISTDSHSLPRFQCC